MTPTPQQLKAALAILTAVAETIREVGEVPSGHLYTLLMDKVSYEGYQKLIGNLKGAGLVRETGQNLLIWTGPKFEKERAS